MEVARGDAVEGVEEAGYAVEDGAGAGVEGHVVEGGEGEDDAGVACAECEHGVVERRAVGSRPIMLG